MCHFWFMYRSNNTNKHSPQEHIMKQSGKVICSNNTNKHSPQELPILQFHLHHRSNNTNKHSPQEPSVSAYRRS